MALGRLLQVMKGTDNLQAALNIFTRLRTRAAGGKVNTPCDDKEIELALGRHLEVMGGADSMKAAQDIYTRLRIRAAGGVENTPCEDKEIELTLGRHLQIMGGTDNLRAALDIFTRLRTLAAGGQVNTPCGDKDIELGLAAVFIDTGEWERFDGLQLDKQLFAGFETWLCFSIRYFRELKEVVDILPAHATLLGKALHWAALAVEGSERTSASCLSQLAHCFRLLSAWPQLNLQALGIEETKEQEFKHTSKLFFDLANDLEPYRQELKKDDRWRQKERKLLAFMTGEAPPPSSI
ncbi:hypothetical protein E1189_05295, partial [Sansalvadorimonas verongulae]|nr:hypothetical protein [Sansalvadorimonas verongulae]